MKLTNLITLLLCLLLVGCSGNSQKDTPKDHKNKTTKTAKTTKATKDAKPVPPKQLEAAAAIISGVDQDQLAELDGMKLFKTNCALCHGFKGDMKVNGAKDLTLSTISLREAVAQVYFGRGLMQPYKGLLSDAEIIAVSRYSETLRQN